MLVQRSITKTKGTRGSKSRPRGGKARKRKPRAVEAAAAQLAVTAAPNCRLPDLSRGVYQDLLIADRSFANLFRPFADLVRPRAGVAHIWSERQAVISFKAFFVPAVILQQRARPVHDPLRHRGRNAGLASYGKLKQLAEATRFDIWWEGPTIGGISLLHVVPNGKVTLVIGRGSQ